eukprot:scaffold2580_cov388-Prasinococcus_capsulatus_cf.AAC.16
MFLFTAGHATAVAEPKDSSILEDEYWPVKADDRGPVNKAGAGWQARYIGQETMQSRCVVHDALSTRRYPIPCPASGERASPVPMLFFCRSGRAVFRTEGGQWSQKMDIDKVGLSGVLQLVGKERPKNASKLGCLVPQRCGQETFDPSDASVAGYQVYEIAVSLKKCSGDDAIIVVVKPYAVLLNLSGVPLQLSQLNVLGHRPDVDKSNTTILEDGQAVDFQWEPTHEGWPFTEKNRKSLQLKARPLVSSRRRNVLEDPDLRLKLSEAEIELSRDEDESDGEGCSNGEVIRSSNFVSYWWSGKFGLEDTTDFALRIFNEDDRTFHILPAFVNFKDSTIVCTFGRLDTNQPYRIDNRTKSAQAFIQQESMPDQCPWEAVDPGMSVPFAWNDPLGVRKLIIQVGLKDGREGALASSDCGGIARGVDLEDLGFRSEIAIQRSFVSTQAVCLSTCLSRRAVCVSKC